MDLNELRRQIDEIDTKLLKLFSERMEISAEIARYKRKHNLPVYDPEREKQKLRGMPSEAAALYSVIFELSRAKQEKIITAKRFGLLGEKLAHSFSPQIHSELGGYEYKLHEVPPDELRDFILSGDYDGFNVTIPYKKAVIPFCGVLSETARITGSINTITKLPDGSLYGDNTDYFGFMYLLKKTGINPAGKKTLIFGSGGSSTMVQAVLRDMGSKEAVVISRSGADNYGNIERHGDAVLIINTTPVGMYPNNGDSPLGDLGIFKSCELVIDLIYNPACTELIMQAKERGIPAVNGLDMLVAQAKKSAEIFTGETIPDTQIEVISKKIALSMRNIVLIGMPGCGKSSVGAELAKKLGREHADTDVLVEKFAGKPIPAIFEEDGEDAFREHETEALRSVCKNTGLVISTGGGIVERQKNQNIIKQNGIIFFLDRDISQLPISGRPLSESKGVEALAAARLPIYSFWSDYIIPTESVCEAAAAVCEKLDI